MTYQDVCLAYSQPGTPAPLAGLSGLVLDAQARAAREREIGLVQAQFLVSVTPRLKPGACRWLPPAVCTHTTDRPATLRLLTEALPSSTRLEEPNMS
jgi:hypothetical protein